MIPQLIAKMFEVDATSDVTPRYNQLSFGEQLQHCTDFDVYADDSKRQLAPCGSFVASHSVASRTHRPKH